MANRWRAGWSGRSDRRAEIMDHVHPGGLGGTFGGNLLSCASALATLDEIDRCGLVGRADAIGVTLAARFSAGVSAIPMSATPGAWRDARDRTSTGKGSERQRRNPPGRRCGVSSAACC